MPHLDVNNIEIMASGLEYPEGPIHCADGSIILVEIKGKRLTLVPANGSSAIKLADVPEGPNGAAVGADGKIYICNDGGFDWIGLPPSKPVLWVAGNQPANYTSGSLDRVDVHTGTVETLFSECTKRQSPPGTPAPNWNPAYRLCGPDDLVVDALGGIWLTDYGKMREREKDITGVYYISPDLKTITQAVYPLNNPNGIALSPDGSKLYVALTFERKVIYYELTEPGVIKPNPATLDGSYLLSADFVGQSVLDSMAVDSAGNVYVATMLPHGNNPASHGGISIITPEGDTTFFELALPDHGFDPLPSNICFGGPDMRTAYVTCGGSGHLLKVPSAVPGLKLNFNGSAFALNR